MGIDLEGVRDAGLKVEHVIGCEILNGTCSDGWLDGLAGESQYSKYGQIDDKFSHPFHTLTEDDVNALEQLFRLRDCNYRHVMDHPKFRLLHGRGDAIFENCPENPFVEDLSDTTVLYNAMRSQKDCNTDPISLLDTLGKNAPELANLANVSRYSDHDSTASAAVEVEQTSPSASELFEDEMEDSASYHDGESVDTGVVSTMMNEEEEDSSTSSGGDSNPKGLLWTVQIFIVSVIVLWVGFMIARSRKSHKEYTQGDLDGIMPTITENRNRPLSEIM